MTFSLADHVWNRAALEGGGRSARRGDRALSAVLVIHGLVMNGGLEHCLEAAESQELDAAIEGFRYFGATEAADVFVRAREVGPEAPETVLERFEDRYFELFPHDQALVELFQRHFAERPEDFAPVVT